MFITFEGIDGSGKTTQIRLLKKWFNNKGEKVKVTEEPTKDSAITKPLFEHMNNSSTPQWVDALLFAADRAMHIEQEIIPSLNRGLIVICDRYIHSSIAYQTALGLDKEWLKTLNSVFPKPNLTIYLDVKAETALKRISEREQRTIKYENEPVLNKVRKEYKSMENKRFKIINGEKTIEEVHKSIIGVINDFM